MNIDVLQAENGDCLLVSFLGLDEKKNILIDGGVKNSKNILKKKLEDICSKGEKYYCV